MRARERKLREGEKERERERERKWLGKIIYVSKLPLQGSIQSGPTS
jgi:hypothetical protein